MSKIKDLKIKHPEFKLDIINGLSQFDPSGNNKYLQYMIDASKGSVEDYFTSNKFIGDVFKELIDMVTSFDENCKNNLIENKDIYSYDSLLDVVTENADAKTKLSNRNIKDQETIVLFENKELILLKCLTERSSSLYGKNTQWCTSADKSENTFDDYVENGILIYLIFKSPPDGLPTAFNKVGFNRKTVSDSLQMWDNISDELGIHNYMALNKFIPAEVGVIIDNEANLMVPNSCLIKIDGVVKATNTSRIDETLVNIAEYIENLNKK